MEWSGLVWCGVVRSGMEWGGVVWYDVVRCGVVWRGVVWCGVARCGMVWCGAVWSGLVQVAAWTVKAFNHDKFRWSELVITHEDHPKCSGCGGITATAAEGSTCLQRSTPVCIQ